MSDKSTDHKFQVKDLRLDRIIGYVRAPTRAEAISRADGRWPGRELKIVDIGSWGSK